MDTLMDTQSGSVGVAMATHWQGFLLGQESFSSDSIDL